jgi:hypothetical protein
MFLNSNEFILAERGQLDKKEVSEIETEDTKGTTPNRSSDQGDGRIGKKGLFALLCG